MLTNLANGGTIRNQLFYSRYGFELYSNFTFYKEDPGNSDQIRQKEDRNIYGYNASYQKQFFIGHLKTETTAGAQLRYDDINGSELTRTRDRVTNTADIMRGNINEANVGAYWAQRFSFSKNLDVTGAVRADYFTNRYRDQLTSNILTTHVTLISPKLNFNYRLNERVQL